ncbi:MAG: DegV family protein [Lachnospiraceae bacterium]|nr:DegV family protein [Lachnospiraceae bacterium]
MKEYGILVDSGCELDSMELPDNTGFEKVPLKIRIGEREFCDDSRIDMEDFHRTLADYRGKTSSAAPAPGEWAEACRPYEKAIALPITGMLSGSCASANAAVNMLAEEAPEKQVFVLDTLSAGPEISLLAHKAAELIRRKLDFAALREQLCAYHKKTRLLFVLESVQNLANNGRVSRIEAKLMQTLRIQLLGRASDEGTLEPLSKCRGKGRVWQKLLEQMHAEGYRGGRVIISHCNNPQSAKELRELLLERFREAKISIMNTKGLTSYYAENGGVLVGYETV